MVRSSLASYQAQLRVYEPLSSFSGSRASYWRQYVDCGYGRTDEPLKDERAAMLQAIITEDVNFGRLDLPDAALVQDWDGIPVVCPLDSRSRALQAIVDSEWKVPYPLNIYSVDRRVRRHAASLQLQPSVINGRGSDHILTANWQIPFWWALLFIPQDCVEDPILPGESERPERLLFRTDLMEAMGRAEQALILIDATFSEVTFTGDLQVVVKWLNSFDKRSMIELDYGALVDFVCDEFEDDETIETARHAIDSLVAGDPAEALAAYREYMDTWEGISRIESWN